MGVARVSTERQAGADRESLNQQEEALRAWAATMGHEVVEILRIAASGADADAPHLKRVSMLVREGRVDIVAFSALDRAFRDTPLALTRFEEWESGGIELIANGTRFSVLDPQGKFMTTLAVATNAMERDKLRARAGGNHRRVSRGVWPRKLPIGYARGPDKRLIKTQVLDIVAKFFGDVASMGLPFALTQPAALELELRRSTGQVMIESIVYRGMIPFGERAYPYEAYRAVSDATWEEANSKLAIKRARRASPVDALVAELGDVAVAAALLEQTIMLCPRCPPTIEARLHFDGVKTVRAREVPYVACQHGHSFPAIPQDALSDLAMPLRTCWVCNAIRKRAFTVARCAGGFRIRCKECGWHARTPRFPYGKPRPHGTRDRTLDEYTQSESIRV